MEQGIFKLPKDDRLSVRCEIAGILKRLKCPPTNISKEEYKALRSPRNNKDRVMVVKHEGNCMVVMDKKSFNDKILSLLEN